MGAKKVRMTLRQVLTTVACIIIVFVVMLIIIPSPSFPPKSYLEEQELLVPAITFSGIIAAGVIGGLILTVVNERIQTYSWRRDQALRDIEAIYEPLYQDISRMVKATEWLSHIHYPSAIISWGSIRDSSLGARLTIKECQLYEDLQYIFNTYREYATRLSDAFKMVHAIAREVIEKRLNQSIAQGNLALNEPFPKPPSKPEEPTRTFKEVLLDGIPDRLGYQDEIYSGFLKGKSVREWGALHRDDPEWYIRAAVSGVKEFTHSKYVAFEMEEIETMLDEIYHKVQDASEIREKTSWCEDFNQQAIRVKKKLEEHIVKPQLP